MSFEWQTEEDGGWDDPDLYSSDPDEQKPDGKRRGWRWLIWLSLLIGAFAAAGWTLNQRVQMSTSRVEADVLASYELVKQAASRQDDDLFQSVLSGRDGAWSGEMTQLMVGGDLTSRSGIGLTTVPVTHSITPTIEMAADLREAEVMTVLPYAIEIGNGLTETVQLRQTAVYRQGPNRWLLSPPDAAYWGDTRRIGGQYVNLFYPERDKEIAQDLLLSLDAKVGQVCTQLPDVDCPNEYKLVVELTTDPGALTRLSLISVVGNADGRHLMLPTPTLVGLPQDQAGEQALFRGFGRLVAAAVLTDLWGYNCCDDGVALYMAVLEDYLRRLGLMPKIGEGETAVSPDVYDALLAGDPPQLFDEQSVWFEQGANFSWMPESMAAVLLLFAQEKLDISGQELVQNLDKLGGKRPFGDWLLTLTEARLSESELENVWRSFIYTNSSAAQQEPPIPFPDQDIQLLCQMGDEERMALYRYDLAQNVTILDQPLNRFADKMVALPDDNGLAVWEADTEQSLTQLFLWVDGIRTEISWDAGENTPGPIPLHMDPSNTKLILSPAQFGQANYGLLDVPSCLDDTCQLETVAGYPIWSPDRVHMILLSGTMFTPHQAHAFGVLTLADESGAEIRRLDFGSSPFWLDDETFGFVADTGDNSRHTIVTGKVDESGGTDWDVLLTAEDLTAVLNTDQSLMIDFVALYPQNPDQVVIMTSAVVSNWQTIFIYDWVTEEIVIAEPFFMNEGREQFYRFSPNGRFLLLSQFELNNDKQNSLFVIDLTDGGVLTGIHLPDKENTVYWMTDFSQDGEWLLVADKAVITISVPGTPYERLIFPETGACKTAVFVNKKNE